MQKIGILTPLWERGLSYTALNFYHALKERHETGILAYVSNIKGMPRLNVRDEFDVPGLCVYPRTEILSEDLKLWMKPFDTILFMEERFGNYLQTAKDAGKKTVNYVCEAMSPREKDMAEEFDLVISPREIEGTTRIQLGVDTDFFKPREEDKEKRKNVRMFAPMGWGGDYDRKNDDAVTKALSRVQCRGKTEILIHRQGFQRQVVIDHMVRHLTQVFTREEMRNTYAESDVCVYCPKWFRGDLTVMEAMACGLPIVTLDTSRIKGKVCGVCTMAQDIERHDGVFENAYTPDIHDLAEGIIELSEGDLEKQKKEAREMAIDRYDWQKNKVGFLELMEGI